MFDFKVIDTLWFSKNLVFSDVHTKIVNKVIITFLKIPVFGEGKVENFGRGKQFLSSAGQISRL